MKIVFLDKSHFQKPFEQFNYSVLDTAGQFYAYDHTKSDKIVERCYDADIIIVLKTQLTADIINQLKQTKLICKVGTGVNNIDVKAAKANKITVTNFPGYASSIVSQWTITLLLMLAGNVAQYHHAVKSNFWLNSQFLYPIHDVQQKKLGIIGYGHIGQATAKLGLALGMRVLVNTKYPDNNTAIKFVDRNTIYAEADFLSLHCLLNEKNTGLINKNVLNKMKPTSYLINTSRAGLIDKQDLLNALITGKIAGAAIDGFWQEPPGRDDPFFSLENIIITPHVAWGSMETRQRLLNDISKRIKQFVDGEKIPAVVSFA